MKKWLFLSIARLAKFDVLGQHSLVSTVCGKWKKSTKKEKNKISYSTGDCPKRLLGFFNSKNPCPIAYKPGQLEANP